MVGFQLPSAWSTAELGRVENRKVKKINHPCLNRCLIVHVANLSKNSSQGEMLAESLREKNIYLQSKCCLFLRGRGKQFSTCLQALFSTWKLTPENIQRFLHFCKCFFLFENRHQRIFSNGLACFSMCACKQGDDKAGKWNAIWNWNGSRTKCLCTPEEHSCYVKYQISLLFTWDVHLADYHLQCKYCSCKEIRLKHFTVIIFHCFEP